MVGMVSLTGQIFETGHPNDGQGRLKTDQKQYNLMRSFLYRGQDFGTGHDFGTG